MTASLTDFHSHILPGIDDGSETVAESIRMLQTEAQQGIVRVVATPHFYPRYDSPERFLRRRETAVNRLRAEMEKHTGLPEIVLGAEVYYFRGMSESEYLNQLTIGQKGCILIEMPPAPWPDEVYRELEDIWRLRRLVPVVAHIDRYIGPFRTFGIPKRLEATPALVQANADFFLERRTASMALRFLREGKIHLLGSDCHNMDSRSPNLGEAVRKIQQTLGPGALERIISFEKEILGTECLC